MSCGPPGAGEHAASSSEPPWQLQAALSAAVPLGAATAVALEEASAGLQIVGAVHVTCDSNTAMTVAAMVASAVDVSFYAIRYDFGADDSGQLVLERAAEVPWPGKSLQASASMVLTGEPKQLSAVVPRFAGHAMQWMEWVAADEAGQERIVRFPLPACAVEAAGAEVAAGQPEKLAAMMGPAKAAAMAEASAPSISHPTGDEP